MSVRDSANGSATGSSTGDGAALSMDGAYGTGAATALGSSRLGPAERETALARLATEEVDLVVAGAVPVGAVGRRKALRVARALRRDSFVGAIQYWDAQVDDARFVMMAMRTAAEYGAQIATRAQCIGFLREGERVTGVRVRDLESGSTNEV